MINKPANWEEFDDSEIVSDNLKAGIYPAQIRKVVDVPDKEYLEIQFDLVNDKRYANYFAKLKENLKVEEWPNQGIYRASYKETATKFFKAFITAVQKSNQGYVWNWDYNSLIGKFMVAVFGEEEYETNGEVKVGIKIREIRSIEAYQKGDIKIPALKKLKQIKLEKQEHSEQYLVLLFECLKNNGIAL